MTKIGFFDSGLGGLSIVQELFKQGLSASIYYFSDLEHHPYGELSKESIIARNKEIVSSIIKQNLDLIVVGCNTATVHSIASLREEFDIPFVGVEPYLNATNHFHLNDVTLLATERTCQSDHLKLKMSELPGSINITVHPCVQLANGIEQYLRTGDKHQLNRALEMDLSQFQDIENGHYILGCTHYGLVEQELKEFMGGTFYRTEPAVVAQIKRLLPDINTQVKRELFFKENLEDEWIGIEDCSHQFLASPALNNLLK